jgi:hypothetical protein
VLLASVGEGEVEPGSAVATLSEIAPRLRPGSRGPRYEAQIDRAASAWRPEQHERIRALVTDVPGESARLMRSAMYRLMKLPEPDRPAQTRPVPVPRLLAAAAGGLGQYNAAAGDLGQSSTAETAGAPW